MTEPGGTWVFEAGADAPLSAVGGKGLNLLRMTRAGLPVPTFFVVGTDAYERFVAGLDLGLDRLAGLGPSDVEQVRVEAARVRDIIEGAALPDELRAAIVAAYRALGDTLKVAARSSATLEDLAEASFAGQQDTVLNLHDEETLLRAVQRCWGSLFTDRAVLYRRQHGFADEGAALAVVVQQMVEPAVSGILFTADPVSQHRGVCSIDASYGLGEALVSGKVNADLYRVEKDSGRVLETRVGDKALGIFALPAGGTEERPIPDADRARPCLSDAQLAGLVALARTVESHQGAPQDIEWAIDGAGTLHLLQTRAITSLFPLVEPVRAPGDTSVHAFVSIGHIQVMTEAMRPFGATFLQAGFPFGKETPSDDSAVIRTAGGRVFGDFTAALRTFPLSAIFPRILKIVDERVGLSLAAVKDRPAVTAGPGPRVDRHTVFARVLRPVFKGLWRAFWAKDPERVAAALSTTLQRVVDDGRARLDDAPDLSTRLLRVIEVVYGVMPQLLNGFPPVVICGGYAWNRLGKLAPQDVPLTEVQDIVRGLTGNVTTEMDLALADVADLAREVDGLVPALEQGHPPTVVEDVRADFAPKPGGGAFYAAWDAFVDRYGHRCPGEIDASSARWRDDPSSLVMSIVGMSKGDRKKGDHWAHHKAAGERAAALIDRMAKAAPFWRRGRIRRLARMARAYMALREHGKYYLLLFFDEAHRAAQQIAARAVQQGALAAGDDVWFLTFREVAALGRGELSDAQALVLRRRAAYARQRTLTVPRVVTSEGEVPVAAARTDVPDGALGGVAASAGEVVGIARVVRDPRKEVLHDGEILVAPFSDPGWTPLFVHAAGLVMEVGGLMTHGSVVAREYGIPAVVGVDDATTKIKTGQRIRVDGDSGLVTILDDDDDDADGAAA